uniref:Cyclin-like domain-containing protein n=1 Tax=Anopheles minimus TaxID=112268 RepID=A0A182VWU3_9DIPT
MDRWNIFSNGMYCNEYEHDILDTLKECEKHRMSIVYEAPQRKHRTCTVRLIEKICELQSYRRATLHLAIYLLDVFMCNHNIPEPRLNVVALTCLYVACKIEENDLNVPSLAKLNEFLGSAYTKSDFIAMEVIILTFFDWHITIPTASTFLDIFSLNSFNQEDYNDMPKDLATEQTSVEQFARSINETSDIILKHTLRQLKLCKIRPSLLAACCVAAGRLNIKNMPAWNERLARFTGYEYYQLHSFCQSLLSEAFPHSTVFPTLIPRVIDAGCLSEWYDTDDDNVYSSDQSISIITDCSDNTTGDLIGKSVSKRIIDSSSDSDEPNTKKRKIAIIDWSADQ